MFGWIDGRRDSLTGLLVVGEEYLRWLVPGVSLLEEFLASTPQMSIGPR